jgi:hypothetical protein
MIPGFGIMFPTCGSDYVDSEDPEEQSEVEVVCYGRKRVAVKEKDQHDERVKTRPIIPGFANFEFPTCGSCSEGTDPNSCEEVDLRPGGLSKKQQEKMVVDLRKHQEEKIGEHGWSFTRTCKLVSLTYNSSLVDSYTIVVPAANEP